MGAWGIGILENDAARDFLCQLKDEGLRSLRSTISELKRIANREELERDDANVVLVLVAICLARVGTTLRESRRVHGFDTALAACRGKLSLQTLRELAWLLDETLARSELRDLWEDAGMLPKWRARVRRLRRQFEHLLDVATRNESGKPIKARTLRKRR